MIDFIEVRRADVESLCRQYRVKTLELFGSAAKGEFQPANSDLDFLVDFQPMPPSVHSKSYFGLWFALQDLFQRRVDLVETPAIRNRAFLNEIAGSRQVVYAA